MSSKCPHNLDNQLRKDHEMQQFPTDPEEKRLSNRQREVLPHIAASDSLAEGARRASISRTTIYKWMEDDDFRAELSRVRTEWPDLAQAEIQGLMLKAPPSSTRPSTATSPPYSSAPPSALSTWP